VTTTIVHDNKISRLQGGQQELLDIALEAYAIDGAIKDARCGDGKLTAAELNGFKVMITKADGSTEVKTMAELGITELGLNGDTTEIVLPDGRALGPWAIRATDECGKPLSPKPSTLAGRAAITAQATYTRNGVTGTLADVTLVAERDGHRVVQTTSTDASGTRTTISKAYDAAGSLVYAMTSVSNATGTNIANSYDDNCDGVIDRLQSIVTSTTALGVKTELLINKQGNATATAVTTSRQETVTSADGKTISINRDGTGGGWWDQRESRVTNTDSSRVVRTSTTDAANDNNRQFAFEDAA
jgi:hypothetical protein